MSYIEIQNVEKAYDGGELVLNQISLSIEKGEFVTLLGPSGCGKTTLLRSVAGLETIDFGRILIDGKDVTNLPPRQRNVAMVFQQHSLFPTMSVYNNIAFGLKLEKLAKSEIGKRVEEVLALIGLEGSEAKYPSQLSGGELQRVALARCIVNNPQVLLLDEPFSAIDAKLRRALQTSLKEIHSALGMTIVFVTHDQEEAMRMSDRIYLMNNGQIEQSGAPMDLYLSPTSAFVAGFIGHYNLVAGQAWQAAGLSTDATGHYAVRPESIELTEHPREMAPGYATFSGVVRQITYQGNVTRYTVEGPQLTIDVDLLYESHRQYLRGEKVFVIIAEDDIIHYV